MGLGRLSRNDAWGYRQTPLFLLLMCALAYTGPSVLARVSFAVTKRYGQESKLGRKGFFWFILPDHSPSSEEDRTGAQARLQPGGRSRCRGHERVLLHMFCSAYFLIEPWTNPGLTPPTMHWAFPPWSQIEKTPYNWIAWRHFFNRGSFLWWL